ncbi:MAG TPA: trehalose-6-phosphate synthase, partial [Pilimelia sp.]|nr:trehalose-6-phosphate synthase [Pilimelia sp.]
SHPDADAHRRGYSDSTLWPLYHGVHDRPVFQRAWRQAYHRVNRRFAAAAAAAAGPAARVLVHGHRLQLVPGFLRKLRPDLRIGFFLPTPFPPPEIFARLPTRSEILTGLLGADLVGFPGPQAAHNMLRLCHDLLGLGHDNGVLRVGERPVTVSSRTVGVDAAEVARLAGLPSVRARARQLRRRLGDPHTVLLGIDHLDASQGIEQRLTAYEDLLRAGGLDAERTAIVQVVLPDPTPTTSARQALRGRIEHHVGRINGDHARMGGAVVHYLHQHHDLAERVALYLAADVLTVTGLSEDPCLVGKEYAAARTGGDGAVVRSSLTGAEADLPGAYRVNPHDGEALRETVLTALRSDPADRAARLRSMQAAVHRRDAARWAAELLTALTAPVEPLLEAAT